MSIYSEIKLISETLDDGETYRGDCPSCGRRSTFTITKQSDGAVFNCFRATCTLRGNIGVSPSVLTRSKQDGGRKKFHPYTGELRELDESQKEFLSRKIGFTAVHLNRSRVLYAAIDDRYAYPIFDPIGKRVGYVLRDYSGFDGGRKSITRMESDTSNCSWYRGESLSPALLTSVAVVEDIPSAVRLSCYVPITVAMNGSNINDDVRRELASYATNVIWAFDRDNTTNAIKNHRKSALMFDRSTVWVLDKDIKDMTEEELKKYVEEHI